MTKRDLIVFFSLAFVWAMSFIFYRIGVPEFGSLAFSSIRVVLAGTTMFFFVMINEKYRCQVRQHWKILAVIGLISTAIPYTMFAFAAKDVNAGVLSVMNASVPMMSGVVASVFFSEKLSKKQVVGLLIGVLGVGILMNEHIFAEGEHSEIIPMLMALFACVGYAIGANLTREYLKEISPIAITGGSLMIAGSAMMPLAIYSFPYGQMISAKSWFSVLCIGVVSTALALVFMNQLIKNIGAMRATCITLLIPIFTIMLGYFLLGEAMDRMAVIGSVVILIGTYLSLNISIRGLIKPR